MKKQQRRGAWLIGVAWTLWLVPAPVPASVVSSFDEFLLPEERVVPPELTRAMEQLRVGNAQAAESATEQFLRTHQRSVVGHELLGLTRLALGKAPEAERSLRQALELDPQRPTVMALLGQAAVDKGELAQADEWFSKAIKSHAGYAFPHRGRAMVLLRAGRLQDAFTEAKESWRLSGGRDVDSELLLAGILHELERHTEAERLLQDVLLQKPDLPEAILLQGIIKLELEKFDEAATLLTHAAEHDPNSQWARLGNGILKRLDGRLLESRKELEAVAASVPAWPLAHAALAETLLASGDRDAAIAQLQKAEEATPTPTAAKLRAAQLLLKYGYAGEALSRLQPVIAQLPPRARIVLVQAYLQQGRTKPVESELKAGQAAEPKEVFWPLQLARFYLAQERYVEAVAEVAKAETLAPAALDPVAASIQVYAAMKQPSEAVAVAQRLMTRIGKTADAYGLLGTAYELTGQTAQAEAAYLEALKRSPSHLAAIRALAGIYRRSGRVEQAIERLKQARPAHPDELTLVLDLAEAHEQAGQRDRALAVYEEAMARHRDNPALLNNLAFLLSKDPSRLAEAQALAARAHQLAPANPQTADTLGWIAFLRGDLSRAHALLTEASARAPRDAQIQTHLRALDSRQRELSQQSVRSATPAAPQSSPPKPQKRRRHFWWFW